MNAIKLVYWNRRTNYGDLLSPYIVTKLSGLPVIHKDLAWCQKPWRTLLSDMLFHRNFDFRLSHRLFPFEKNYVCIGSIIGQGNKKSCYWGTGFISEGNCSEGTFFAVRGNLSRSDVMKCRISKKINIIGDLVVGDPALLMPLFIPPHPRSHKIGIIPHNVDFDYLMKTYGNRYYIIHLANSDVEEVTKKIIDCEYILSSSLHGLIVAHAYNIPALWIEHTELNPGSNHYKFRDYFSSVKISYDEPFRNISDILSSQHSIDNLFHENMKKALPQCDVDIIRKDLLKSVPFPVKAEFQVK